MGGANIYASRPLGVSRMSESQHTEAPSAGEQTEAWFLAHLAKQPINTALLLAALRTLRDSGRAAEAEQRAELLQDTLADRKKSEQALETLHLRARWASLEGRKDTNWAEEVEDVLGGEWEVKALIDESGFNRPVVSGVEAVRRLQLLLKLREGAMVYDRTWGLGSVSRLDSFNKKIEIDFERRTGHQMSFAYAAESLTLVGNDHILMWRRKRQEDLRNLVKNDPAEVVRMALASFGPSTVAQLQTALCSGIVLESDWKRFWEQARKKLKSDAAVHIPSARSEALRLLEGAQSQQDQWFDAIARERSLAKIVAALEELAGRQSIPTFNESQRGVLLDRLGFALKGAPSTDFSTRARIVMVAATLHLEDRLAADRVPDFFNGRAFDETLKQLPARPLRAFLRYLHQHDAARLRALILDRIDRAEIGILNEALSYLEEIGAEAEVAKRFKQAFDTRAPSLEMLSWLSRNTEKHAVWGITTTALMVQFMIEATEQEANGDRLKAQNQLRERFAKPEWLKVVMESLSATERQQMVLRIKESNGWPALDRASVLGQIVKLDASLAPLLVAGEDQAPASRGPVTSKRSFRERQEQLDRIVRVEIPQVAKDIALARSYGDLRENHEYKAAKEAQAILFRRRDELLQELGRVTPSDFKGFQTEKAGVATTVTLAYEDGKRETYHILGLWDGDTTQHIISSASRMAEALNGYMAGEKLMVPSERGEVEVTLVSVEPLPSAILDAVSRE